MSTHLSPADTAAAYLAKQMNAHVTQELHQMHLDGQDPAQGWRLAVMCDVRLDPQSMQVRNNYCFARIPPGMDAPPGFLVFGHE